MISPYFLVLTATLGLGIALRIKHNSPLATGHIPLFASNPTVAAFARRSAICQITSLAVGIAFAWRLATIDEFGIGVAMAPSALAICLLIGVLIGELSIGDRSSGTRNAILEVRSVWTYLSRTTIRVLAVLAGLFLTTLTITSIVGAPDELGRPGRSLTILCNPGQENSSGPWPGTFYSLPMGAVVLTGIILAAITLRTVLHRPRLTSDENILAADDALRRNSVQKITAAVGFLIAAPLAGAAYSAAVALHMNCEGKPMLTTFTALSMIVSGVAVIAACAFVVDLFPRSVFR